MNKDKKKRFITGISMQLLQILILFGMFLSMLDWSWFKIQYVYALVGVLILVGYNIFSWYLIYSGTKEND